MNASTIAQVAIYGYALISVLAYAALLLRRHRQHLRLQAQYEVLCDADAIVEAELIRILTAQSN